jgi:DNA-binding response OmpR family regulator
VVIDLAGRVVMRAGAPVPLTPKEFDLLTFLARHPGQVFTREVLRDYVGGRDFFGGTRTVDVHVRWLRMKLERDAGAPRLIQTIYSVGYKFVPTPAEEGAGVNNLLTTS